MALNIFGHANSNENFFEKEDIGEDETGSSTYNLNTPKHRVKAGMSYYPVKGFSGGLSMRYQNYYRSLKVLELVPSYYRF